VPQGSDIDDTLQDDAAPRVEAAVGSAVRHHRVLAELTLRQLGQRAGLSPAMISRIENGQVSPSLATLAALAGALNVPIIALFQNTMRTADITYVRAGAGLAAKRIAPGHIHDYRILGLFANNALRFMSAEVTLERKDDGTHPVYSGPGYVFITVTDGTCIYSCGGQEFELRTGDSITFDAQLSHGVLRTTTERVTFLTVSARPA
jgi:transcriptional regulator with XRE-family HTH domain